ncbi:MAG: BglG family transcription antiterminator [Sarcina sp.]
MREKLILEKLKDGGHITMAELVRHLKVTDRTIRNEIKVINSIGVKKGFSILNARGKGYYLEIYNEDNFNAYLVSLDGFDDGVDKDLRVDRIVMILLTAKEYRTIDSIADDLGYSRSTIIKDLDDVEEKVKTFDLGLEKRSGFGLKIKGAEFLIRKAMAKYIFDIDTFFGDEANVEDNELYQRVEEIFIKGIIEYNIKISNLAVENILYHLKTLILRLRRENFLMEDNSEVLEIINHEEYEKISIRVCNEIGRSLNKMIPPREIDYLTTHIVLKSEYSSLDEDFKAKLEDEVIEILEELDKYYGTKFIENQELKSNLVMHVYSLINRARNNVQLSNPLLEEVNTRYPIVVSIAIAFVDKLCEKYKMVVLKDEIGFIALHFATHFEKAKENKLSNIKKIAVICSSGGGIAYLIKLKLERMFSNAIIKSFSNIHTSEITKDKFDLVLKTVDFDRQFDIPTMDVKNFLDDNELDSIKRYLESSFEHRDEFISAKDYITDVISFKELQGGSKVNYIDFLKSESKNLFDKGYVGEDFEGLVLERESKLSTAYVKGLAGPHAIEMNAMQNSINITVFKEPINWGAKKVQIVFFISMKKGNLNLHKKMSKIMLKLIEKDRLRKEVISAGSKKAFMNLIKEYL